MPPFPGMPYGPAPAWCFPVFECSMYLLFIVCMWHALNRGKQEVMYLVGGLLFGLILEYIEVITGSYTYSKFIVMFGKAPLNIPLCIGAGWGIIMYTARLFTDRLGLSLLAAAALDTLIALNIDLSMDTVAYRLHMWHWNWAGSGLDPLRAQWFGIPFGNFIGWQTVVFCYSSFSRFFEKKILVHSASGTKYIISASLALVCSQIVLFTTETFIYPFLYTYLGILSVYRFTAAIIILLLLVFFGWRKRRQAAANIPAVTWWVPAWFHLFFTACFFALGFYMENKWMTTAACLNLLAGILLHVFPLSFTYPKKSDETSPVQ